MRHRQQRTAPGPDQLRQAKTNIEFGRFDFEVSIAEGVRSTTSQEGTRTTSTRESRSTTTPRDRQYPARASEGCHPAYTPCLPIDRDVSCEEALRIADGKEIRLRDRHDDPYKLDDATGPGNGIGCDGIG